MYILLCVLPSLNKGFTYLLKEWLSSLHGVHTWRPRKQVKSVSSCLYFQDVATGFDSTQKHLTVSEMAHVEEDL